MLPSFALSSHELQLEAELERSLPLATRTLRHYSMKNHKRQGIAHQKKIASLRAYLRFERSEVSLN